MPRHGLNQLLNSIGFCLVMLTGLGIGMWVSHLNMQHAQMLKPSGAENHSEESVVRSKRIRSLERPLRDGSLRPVNYQEEDTGLQDVPQSAASETQPEVLASPQNTVETAIDLNEHKSSTPQGIQLVSAEETPVSITISSSLPTSPGGTFLSNNLNAIVSVAIKDKPDDVTNATVHIVDVRSQSILGTKPLGANIADDIDVEFSKAGVFIIEAQYLKTPDDQVVTRSQPIRIMILKDGPTYDRVVPINFGSEAIGKDIRVSFVTPIEIQGTYSPNDLKGNFELKRRHGRTDTSAETHFDITEARLDSDRKTVILTTADDPAVDTYRLIIKGTLTDILGNPFRGDGVTPGTDHSIILSPALALASGFEPEVPAPKRVEHVPYQEYTKARSNPETFLPSDHVETRVARLYYYRDAHRVAQIINREVESLNHQAVSMKRQLADKVRRAADEKTDERRAFEMRAVQAAQKARQLENELQNEQANLAQAEQTVEEISQALEADEVRKSNLQAELEDMRTQFDEMNNQPEPPEAEKEEFDKTLKHLPILISRHEAMLKSLDLSIAPAKRKQTAANADANASRSRIGAIAGQLEVARDAEIKAANDAADKQAEEDRLREDQFRREVAAAHEDPDTYAAGKPDSDDPVAQVSISVIGEGVIQLRGPLAGINKIRTMINEIDQPVGQVRISIHTAQVNGEHGDRMEKVVGRIDNYIEHARFLTTQSTEMLRQSILQVASLKAMEAEAMCVGRSQAERDKKYLYAFFGEDFIDELCQMDSEFLKTGNKLLSLHSMDTTSLASALFVMALAKNDTRNEILYIFNSKLEGELVDAELNYHQAGYAPHFLWDGKKKTKRMVEKGVNQEDRLMAFNAKFANFAGFFNAQVHGTDTLNPSQREFLKLAQIFKSRMITEVELRQRVVERGLIEQNDPDRNGTLRRRQIEAGEAEKQQEEALEKRIEIQETAALELTTAIAVMRSNLDPATALRGLSELERVIDAIDDVMKENNNRNIDLRAKVLEKLEPNAKPSTEGRSTNTPNDIQIDQKAMTVRFDIVSKGVAYPVKIRLRQALNDSVVEFAGAGQRLAPTEKEFMEAWNELIHQAIDENYGMVTYCSQFTWQDPSLRKLIASETRWVQQVAATIRSRGAVDDQRRRLSNIKILVYGHRNLIHIYKDAQARVECWSSMATVLLDLLVADPYDHAAVMRQWTKLKSQVAHGLKPEFKTKINTVEIDRKVTEQFAELETQVRRQLIAVQRAKLRAYPLDHRRFLDHLIAETEDKYIELLEGTRAHTANIDNYIKRLITALDDDFNTQFYKPAFQGVRQASRMWDVNLAQIETTSILTNNRQFGKVSPQATMEFDLPKRDILIQEAFDGAMAAYDQYGAMLTDPTFLALTKLHSGQPTSSPAHHGAGGSSVRNVLPGLPSATDEHIMAQAGPGTREFDTPLEALIPDPAIYKFETGTGFEIRPVIQPDGQAVVFHFNYMYRTNVREPVRADEKHLGRVKQHFIDTDVQLSNFELRKVSDYQIALKASRTSRGVPLFEDIPGVGMLFRPLPSAESSLQQNIVMAQATIFPTLFDLMGLRWAPAVADIDSQSLRYDDYRARGRRKTVSDQVYDFSSQKVDEFLQIEKTYKKDTFPNNPRRPKLYRSQRPIPEYHPDEVSPIYEPSKCQDGDLWNGGYSVEGGYPAPLRSHEGGQQPSSDEWIEQIRPDGPGLQMPAPGSLSPRPPAPTSSSSLPPNDEFDGLPLPTSMNLRRMPTTGANPTSTRSRSLPRGEQGNPFGEPAQGTQGNALQEDRVTPAGYYAGASRPDRTSGSDDDGTARSSRRIQEEDDDVEGRVRLEGDNTAPPRKKKFLPLLRSKF
ncbi:MAG: hypothetical protein WEB58_14205 [Planctomycetaceae bacterium]